MPSRKRVLGTTKKSRTPITEELAEELAREAEAGYDLSLLAAVANVNRLQHERIVTKIRNAAGREPLNGVVVALWGLTFKANCDDLRDSPAMAVAARLLAGGARVRAYDPVAGERAAELLPELDVVADAYDACLGADVLAVLTEWDEFRWLDFERVGEAMQRRSIVDARNLLDPAAMRKRGFGYEGVGR